MSRRPVSTRPAVRAELPILLPKQRLGQVWVTLPMLVKVGEVRHRQHGGVRARPIAEQGSLHPVLVPILARQPRHPGSFGPLQIPVYGSETNRATAGYCAQPQTYLNFNRRTSLILRMDNLLAGKQSSPSQGGYGVHLHPGNRVHIPPDSPAFGRPTR
jgi:hypothetical protein